MRFRNPVSAAMVKAEAARRIEDRYPMFRQVNILREGGVALAEMSAWIDGCRATSNRIEAMAPIPPDFTADSYWV